MPRLLEMSDTRRQLLLSVAQNDPSALKILHELTGYVRCDEILAWLLKNKIVGNQLAVFVNGALSGSVLGMAQNVIRRIDKTMDLRPLIMGRDYMKENHT